MISIYEAVASNKNEAKELLRNNGNHVTFTDDSDLPYVLLSDDDGVVGDFRVTEARLNEHDEIEIFIPDEPYEDWIPGNYALSMSIDEVYQKVNDEINGK